MAVLGKVALGLVALAALGTGARAADVTPIVIPTVPTVAPVVVDTGFDWRGPYVGGFGSIIFLQGSFSLANAAALAGYNFTAGRFLVGTRAYVGGYFLSPDSGFGVGVDGRAGVALDRVAIYAMFGAIGYSLPVSWYAYAGGGVEFALGDRLSVFTEVRLEEIFTPPLYIHAVAGLNFHFGD